MPDEIHNDGKATIALVYKLVGELRAEMSAQLNTLDAKMEARFDSILDAVNSLRDGMVSCGVCDERHRRDDERVDAHITASEKDRQDIWNYLHEMEGKFASKLTERVVFAGVGLILIAVFGGIIDLIIST